MSRIDIPFNIRILVLTDKLLEGIRPVTALDIFDGNTSNFHENGLYSTLTFGRTGDPNRNKRVSYIDIKVPIFHPIIYNVLTSMKHLYAGIMAGQEYAIWNKEINDFERSNSLEGKTGFGFFVDHWKDIDYGNTKSTSREQSVRLLKKYQADAFTSKIVVMPAGLRDIEIKNDRVNEDEINKIYRSLLGISNTISTTAVRINPEILDTARFNLQKKFNELYAFIESMIRGKKKMMQGKWASRKIFNGTRNVITTTDITPSYLGEEGGVDFNNTQVGLYQGLKAILPVARFYIRNEYLSKCFPDIHAPAMLVNKKTLKSEQVPMKAEYFDRWATNEGIEKIITSFSDENLRHRPIEVDGHYLALIYAGPDGTFKFIQDIDEVPPGREKSDVHPITLCELLYLSLYRRANKYPLFVTRYPVAGVGSIYPSRTYLRTTVDYEKRVELGDNWEALGKDHTAYQFPIMGRPFINSLIPHPTKLKGLGADHDGDTASCNCTYSDDSIEEVEEFLSLRRAYVGTDGRFLSTTSIDTVDLLLYNLTGD
jgi:hypothetical protein